MRRAGVEIGPLAHVKTVEELRVALDRLTDAQLLDLYEKECQNWAAGLTDDELLAELEKVKQQEQLGNPNEEQS
jgi:hypothetical protein